MVSLCCQYVSVLVSCRDVWGEWRQHLMQGELLLSHSSPPPGHLLDSADVTGTGGTQRSSKYFSKMGNIFTRREIFSIMQLSSDHTEQAPQWASWICSRFKEPEKKHFYSWCRLSIYNYVPVVIKFLLYQIYEAFSSTCYSILSS